jgi:hypothetical protein
MATPREARKDSLHEGRDENFIDEDRMVSEGLGGGYVTTQDNGLIGDTTTDTMEQSESILEEEAGTNYSDEA